MTKLRMSQVYIDIIYNENTEDPLDFRKKQPRTKYR
jgi:hypothetical protein